MTVPSSNRVGRSVALALVGSLGCLWAGSSAVRGEELQGPMTHPQVSLFFEEHCLSCHGESRKKGGLTLEPLRSEPAVSAHRDTWQKIAKLLESHEMPPEKRPPPGEGARAAVVAWIRGELARVDCSGPIDPGRCTIRRLNRAEYRNTIRDLVGIDFAASESFPADEVGYGFDNIGDVLSMAPLLVESYVDAADAIVEEAFNPGSKTFRRRFEAEREQATTDVSQVSDDSLSINKNGEVFTTCEFPVDGEYTFRANAYAQQAGPEPARMGIFVDGVELHRFDVTAENLPVLHEARVRVGAGKRRLSVAYLNNYVNNTSPDPKLRGDRNLIVDWFEVEAPATGSLPAPYLRLFGPSREHAANGGEVARRILQDFAPRAYRRDLAPQELERLLEVVETAREAGDVLEDAVRVALKVILASPHFLFRVERIEAPSTPEAIHPVTDFELATRLSYFLWSTMPDAELLALAREGRLHEKETLVAQTRRLLEDRRSWALVENFAGQWLQTRFLDAASPDPQLFSAFDAELREAMRQETLLFFESLLREGRSIADLIDADYTFLNERLARHYGIPGVVGDEFRKVRIEDGTRGGLLTMGSFLTITSNPTRTSPVKRGRWILEQLLGEPPPPPPPNVPALVEPKANVEAASLRQRMEKHREDPNCAVCHTRMDAMGFAFENFDAIGSWRDFDGSIPIDPSGSFPDGRSFEGAAGLKKVLRGDLRKVARALCEKMLTYALGRGLEYPDGCVVEKITGALEQGGYKLPALVTEIVLSEPFLLKRGGLAEK